MRGRNKERENTSYSNKPTSNHEMVTSGRKTPRRFHRLTHDRNKIWYYTYVREQY